VKSLLFSAYYKQATIASNPVQKELFPDRFPSVYILESVVTTNCIAIAETDSAPVVECVSSNKEDIVDQTDGRRKLALQKRSKPTQSKHTLRIRNPTAASRCLTKSNVRKPAFVSSRDIAHTSSKSGSYKYHC
jgi:hypothetical protein